MLLPAHRARDEGAAAAHACRAAVDHVDEVQHTVLVVLVLTREGVDVGRLVEGVEADWALVGLFLGLGAGLLGRGLGGELGLALSLVRAPRPHASCLPRFPLSIREFLARLVAEKRRPRLPIIAVLHVRARREDGGTRVSFAPFLERLLTRQL